MTSSPTIERRFLLFMAYLKDKIKKTESIYLFAFEIFHKTLTIEDDLNNFVLFA